MTVNAVNIQSIHTKLLVCALLVIAPLTAAAHGDEIKTNEDVRSSEQYIDAIQEDDDMMGSGMMDFDSFGSSLWEGGNSMMGLGMGSFWLLLVALVIGVVVWVAKISQSTPQNKSALDLLNERYAKGEIDKKEFEQKKEDIN